MDRWAVLQPQVDRLTCENTSTHWHSQAPDKPTRAPFATQSATHFDLAPSIRLPSKQVLRNPIRLNRTRPSPTPTVAVPGYCFNSLCHSLPVSTAPQCGPSCASPTLVQDSPAAYTQALRPGDAGNPLPERLGGKRGHGDYPQRSSADGLQTASPNPSEWSLTWPNFPDDHVNIRACPLYVRTVKDAKRLTPRTGTDSIRTRILTCCFTVMAPPGQVIVGRAVGRMGPS